MFSCSTGPKNNSILNYKETHTSFFDLAHGDWTSDKWVRKPENLKMLNETFKKFGNKVGAKFFIGLNKTEFFVCSSEIKGIVLFNFEKMKMIKYDFLYSFFKISKLMILVDI